VFLPSVSFILAFALSDPLHDADLLRVALLLAGWVALFVLLLYHFGCCAACVRELRKR